MLMRAARDAELAGMIGNISQLQEVGSCEPPQPCISAKHIAVAEEEDISNVGNVQESRVA